MLTGEYEDCTWGYHRNPFCEFQLKLVPLIPIAKTILGRSRIFHIFTRVENQHLKQRLQRKLRIILKTFQTFSHSLSYRIFFFFLSILLIYILKTRSDRTNN